MKQGIKWWKKRKKTKKKNAKMFQYVKKKKKNRKMTSSDFFFFALPIKTWKIYGMINRNKRKRRKHIMKLVNN